MAGYGFLALWWTWSAVLDYCHIVSVSVEVEMGLWGKDIGWEEGRKDPEYDSTFACLDASYNCNHDGSVLKPGSWNELDGLSVGNENASPDHIESAEDDIQHVFVHQLGWLEVQILQQEDVEM